jgi:MarR family transcriptional regulator, 2-MHQ and catechol-resistance regulon repressor
MASELSEQQKLSLAVYVKLMRATNTATANIHRHLHHTGLTHSQFAVLEALHHLGPLCQGELSQKVLKSSANITSVVDALEARGLVSRDRSGTDRRKVKVDLTDQGRHLIEELFPHHAEVVEAELSVLTAAEQQELGRLLKKLGRRE